MSFTNLHIPKYYPENYNHSIYYENELKKFQSLTYRYPTLDSKNKKPVALPTINYFNERKCPIYVHNIKPDSSVYYNYGPHVTTPRKKMDTQKPSPQNASKFVLDKLEETYWATWKPKKENEKKPNNLKSPNRVQNLVFSDTKPIFQEHNKVFKKEFNRPHGDVNDNIIKYFNARQFNSSSTTDSVPHETNQKKLNSSSFRKNDITKTHSVGIVTSGSNKVKRDKKLKRPSNSKTLSSAKQDSISQEIQTEVHCPVILEESKEEVRTQQTSGNPSCKEDTQDEFSEKIEDWNRRNSEEIKKAAKRNAKGKKQPKGSKESDKETKNEDTPVITETPKNSGSTNAFAEHKDSIEITKRKQEESGPKEHFQQPKCIRLYRKSAVAAGYIKGGTYPLKSCLRKDISPKGNFKLGAPGTTLFVTTGSFNRRRK